MILLIKALFLTFSLPHNFISFPHTCQHGNIVWLFVKHNCVNSHWRSVIRPFDKCLPHKVNLLGRQEANTQTSDRQTVISRRGSLCILMKRWINVRLQQSPALSLSGYRISNSLTTFTHFSTECNICVDLAFFPLEKSHANAVWAGAGEVAALCSCCCCVGDGR